MGQFRQSSTTSWLYWRRIANAPPRAIHQPIHITKYEKGKPPSIRALKNTHCLLHSLVCVKSYPAYQLRVLTVPLTESIEDARSTIMDSKAASIKSVQDSLYERLDSVSAESDAMLKEAAAIKKIIFKPLGEERLALSTTVNGKTVTEITTLGKSMDNFRNLVDTKEKELKVLWEQWTAVQQEIINFGMDILGPEAFDGVATADGQYFYVKPRDKSDFMKENERLASEFEVERKNLEVDIQTMGEEAVQNMEACEKVGSRILVCGIYLGLL